MNLSSLKTSVAQVSARLEKSRRRRGVLGTVRTAVKYGAHFLLSRYREWKFDWTLGVNTRGTRGRSNTERIFAGIQSDGKESITGFGPSGVALIGDLLASVPIRHEEFAFVDIGSGKGRVLLIASDWPFRKVLGVELSRDLNDIANRNLRNRKGKRPRCENVESVSADARTHPVPAGPVLFFLHNPFHEEALLAFLSNVERSWRETPRPIFILYLNPRLAPVFERFAFLQKVPWGRDYCFLYRTPGAAEAGSFCGPLPPQSL